jgi:hypothetical protein
MRLRIRVRGTIDEIVSQQFHGCDPYLEQRMRKQVPASDETKIRDHQNNEAETSLSDCSKKLASSRNPSVIGS